MVECTPESVALRAVSIDASQRPADRRMVDAALEDLAQQIEGAPVRIWIREQEQVRVGVDQAAAGGLADEVMKRALAGFHKDLPETGLADGARWAATDEPLLALDAYAESFGLEQVVHHCDTLGGPVGGAVAGGGHQVDRRQHTPPRGGGVGESWDPVLPDWRPMQQDEGLPPIELVEEVQARMDAVAVLDPDLGFVTERLWSMRSEGSVWLYRSGGLRLLEDEDVVDLGRTGQVAPAGAERTELPPWTPVHPNAL